MALKNPSQAPRIVPFGQNRLASDKLPNGRWAFRVTQTFAHTDAYFGGKHGALDLGNYECGDKMLASVAGKVTNKRDSYGAMIVESRRVQRCGGRLRPPLQVRRRQRCDRGPRCVHRFRRRHRARRHLPLSTTTAAPLRGVLVDPWPLLEQNAAPQRPS